MKLPSIPCRISALLLLVAFPCVSFSAGSGYDANRVEKRFQPEEEPRSGTKPVLPELKRRVSEQGAFQDILELRTVEITGSTVYTDEDLEPVYTPYLRRPANRELTNELAADVAKKYEADGYPYTQVSIEPPNLPKDAARIVIREAYIDNVVIQGEVKDKKGYFTNLAERIKAMRPVHKPVMERYLLLAQDLAGVYKIEPKIEASEETPGAHTLTLQITPMKTTSGFIYVDNRGMEAVGPSTFVPGIFISNPFGYFGKTSLLMATTAQTRELRFISAGYELPVNDEGTVVKIKASYNKSYPGNPEFPNAPDLEEFDTNTSSATFSLGIEHPFLRTQRKNFTGYGQFDVKYADTRNLPPTKSRTKDEMRVIRLGGDFDYTDSTNAVTRLQLEWSHGLSGLGATDNDSTTKSNDDGIVDFDKVTYSLSRTQPLSFISPKLEAWTLYGAVEGQSSGDALLSGEECGIGGKDFGRAYDSSEIMGERCISGSVELSRSLDTSGIEWLTSGKGYLFYDIGEAKNKGEAAQSLSSTGLGMEFQVSKNTNVSLELAKPLTKKVTNKDDKDLRAFGTLTFMF